MEPRSHGCQPVSFSILAALRQAAESLELGVNLVAAQASYMSFSLHVKVSVIIMFFLNNTYHTLKFSCYIRDMQKYKFLRLVCQ